MNWIKYCLSNYTKLTGRAGHTEYRYFLIFYVGCLFVAITVEVMLSIQPLNQNFGPLSAIVFLATFLPMFAVTVRRLHDLDRSAWWLLLAFLPIVNIVVFLALAVLPNGKESNSYGPPVAA